MRKDIYVVQNNKKEGKELEQWCEENGLPIDNLGANDLTFSETLFNNFCYRHNGFNKNDNNSCGNGKIQVIIEEFKRLQLESLGKSNFKPYDWVKSKSGKSQPFELQPDNFPIRNGLLAGFKVEELEKCEKPQQFEVGKWYKILDNWWAKFKCIHNSGNRWQFSEHIDKNGIYFNVIQSIDEISEIKLLENLNEIQQYLPDNHVDKITPVIQTKWMPKIGDWIYAEKQKKDDHRNDVNHIPVFKLEEINNSKPYIWLRPKKYHSTGVEIRHCRPATQDEISEKLPEYVECIGLIEKNVNTWSHRYKIGQIYKLIGISNSGNYNVMFSESDSMYCDISQFKPSTKEAFDNQFKPKYEVVHCKTQEEWDFVFSKNPKIHYYGDNIYQKAYKKGNGCLNLKCLSHGSLEYYQKDNAKIISFEEWCNKEGITTNVQTVGHSELLEEAKKRYPVGTNYIGIHKKEKNVVDKNPEIRTNGHYSDIRQGVIEIEAGIDYIYLDGQWAEIIQETTNESLVGRVVKRISYEAYNNYRNLAIGEYDIIQSDNGNNWYLKTFMNCEKDNLLKDFELMPIGFQIPLKESSTNSIRFKNMNLEEWLSETKKLNFSLSELENHIGSNYTCRFNIYIKLKGKNSLEKARILCNEWNKPEITSEIHAEDDLFAGSEENHYSSMSETPKFAPNTAVLIPVKTKQIFKN
jgi:hypothetical protein